MIDIHTHVLPGVDDGSPDLDASLELLHIAAECGVTTLVTTPHCNIPGAPENYASPELDGLWRMLAREAERERIPVRLCRGAEIFATEELPELLSDGLVWTLNGTRYFLTEFDFGEEPDFCFYVLDRCRERGFRPVIAHPERYLCVQDDPSIAFEWCTQGYALQLNKGSLLGKFGRPVQITAELLADHGLAACVASDAHSPYQRTTYMGRIREYLTEQFGEAYARLLLQENPSRILAGQELLGLEPIPFR